MADECRRQTMAREKRRFERQQAEQLIPQALIMLYAALSPRPDLRRDIMHTLHAHWSDGAQQAQSETGAVDGHDDIRLPSGDIGDCLMQPSAELTQSWQDFQ